MKKKKSQDSLNLINLFQSVNFVMSLKIVLGEKGIYIRSLFTEESLEEQVPSRAKP